MPTGADLEMVAIHACEYGVYDDGGKRPGPMDLRPIWDALAAHYDGCRTCSARHVATLATSPPLTTHVAGIALLILGIDEATARLLLHHLDTDGTAIALTIRNDGLPAAVEVARVMGTQRRESVVTAALNQLLPSQWYNMPVNNFARVARNRDTRRLGDHEVLTALRTDGHL
jgi:hypothetical protein